MKKQMLASIFLPILSFWAVCVFIYPARAQMPDRLPEIAQSSIVYIYFQRAGQDKPAADFPIGTGFIVSKDGLILTASHLFSKWRQLNAAERANIFAAATLFDKPQNTISGQYRLQVLDLGSEGEEGDDIALMKLPQVRETFSVAPVCFSRPDRSVALGQQIFAFGFPYDQNFQPVPGTLGTQNAPGRRWYATSAFTFGMSGGPIYSSRGYVMGIVKGGLSGTDAVKHITPIQHARSMLAKTSFQEKCEPPGEPVLGNWKGAYNCRGEVGESRISVTRDAEGRLVASEQFSRGILGGSVVHEIKKVAENRYNFNSRVMSFPSFSYQLDFRYDPATESLRGEYNGHPNCQTMLLRRN